MSNDKSNEGYLKQRPNTKNPSVTQTSNNIQFPMQIAKDIYRIIRHLVLFFCRHIIFGPIQFKLLVSFAIIIIGSTLRIFDRAPTSYLSVKSNIFNRYFAKLGWGWTIGLLGPFVYLTLVTTHNQYQILTRHLIRLLIATGIWYIITSFFVYFEAYTAKCKHEDMRGVSREVCLTKGHEWEIGYDFSGHTFLLLYAILIINEEVKSYDKGTKKVDQAEQTTKNSSDKSKNEQERWKLFSKLLRILYVSLAALTVLWEFMLLSTALYFHDAWHKLIAAGLAVFFWYITYYVWYKPDSQSLLYPSTPKE